MSALFALWKFYPIWTLSSIHILVISSCGIYYSTYGEEIPQTADAKIVLEKIENKISKGSLVSNKHLIY